MSTNFVKGSSSQAVSRSTHKSEICFLNGASKPSVLASESAASTHEVIRSTHWLFLRLLKSTMHHVKKLSLSPRGSSLNTAAAISFARLRISKLPPAHTTNFTKVLKSSTLDPKLSNRAERSEALALLLVLRFLGEGGNVVRAPSAPCDCCDPSASFSVSSSPAAVMSPSSTAPLAGIERAAHTSLSISSCVFILRQRLEKPVQRLRGLTVTSSAICTALMQNFFQFFFLFLLLST
mmetsp:Transcript_18726/g.38344  ORF Transcript_18726/g.38344 Transcript_18726/m.38344 type:complete len:236 (-) Transcript_18726:698-1405(-)